MRLRTGASCLVVVAGLLAPQSAPRASTVTAIYVELRSPAPTVVARHEAESAGRSFDAGLHRAAIRLAQDSFLGDLTAAGIPFTLLSTTAIVAGSAVTVPDRYAELINALRLEVAGEDVRRVRAHPAVRHISLDLPRYLNLDRSVPYVRAGGPAGFDSARARGFFGTGTMNPDGSASGQVVAVLDTGVDHTNPMFDARFDDDAFESRTGDVRPVRSQGTPFAPGVHHPKVVYRAVFSTAPAEGDDNGHGTHSSSTAAGLKARADTVINDGEVVEGVAPGALVMDYKICPSLVCDENLILMSLEDAARETDLAGFPKPRATVVNMSFGDCTGNPQAADAVAAGNLTFLGVVPEASAGNLDALRAALCDDHDENTIGSPAAGRLVIAAGATLDPGNEPNGIQVLQDDAALRATPGPAPDPDALPAEPDTRNLPAVFAPESNGGLGFDASVAQYYVYAGFADTPDQVPVSAGGRVCLASRGSTVDAGATGTGLFGHKATECAAKGGIALVVFNNVPGPIGVVTAPSSIPVFTLSQEDGLYLRDTLGFESPAFDPADSLTWDTISNLPIRIQPADPALWVPDTAEFSARGPNNDFRVLKPDVTAPGVEILMGTARVDNPGGFSSASGTSFSGPHVAGAAALVRDPGPGRPDFTPSMARAALMNSATNVRLRDNVTPIPDDDDRNFIHKTGAGLIDLVRATSVKAILGTNELNGAGGPDEPRHPDFLPSHSFGEQRLIGTGRPASDPAQQRSITVTLADVAGLRGTYALSIVDGGALRGDITRPLTEPGFSLALSATKVTASPGKPGTFTLTAAVDGTDAGLLIAGTDDDGNPATEFTWFVVATRSDGTETLRMPFYFRAAQGAPGGGVVGSAAGSGFIEAGTDNRGTFKFNVEATSPPGGRIDYAESGSGVSLSGTVDSATIASATTATFGGPCTLGDGTPCTYTVEAEDNAEPGRGADAFAIRFVANGVTREASGLLGGGNIRIRVD
jgi:subtilisin family serine protease